MDRARPAWFLLRLLLTAADLTAADLTAADLTEAAGPLTDPERVAGRLVFYQTEGSATYLRDSGALASGVATETVFELLGPERNFSSAGFSYTWDLGNGEVIRGTEPVVRYRYSESGNYTLRLNVGGDPPQLAPAGVYVQEVQVLDAIRSIQLVAPLNYSVNQNFSLDLQLDGSPPMWVCWRFLRNCAPDPAPGCTLTLLRAASLRLSHAFDSAGLHCLEVSARNAVSALRMTFSLKVTRNVCCHLLFILSCAAVLAAIFSFILAIACRPRQLNSSQVPASSNATFLKDHGSKVILSFSSVEKGERAPLILQPARQNCC
ncbi:transmembrane protein 130 [Poeciliopsis prolifica]|uniref:transmembrane protein 130 n=1 Tax=Poeciliopsis prolifica TaxID=188132 RepID=UPI002413CE2A|nr:transmembrane protein 130 [Poeciliopsis prolifica]XP_054913776.1 transmembrane protein 130 [Poeciliopsis prolifica]XP_054913777.1 transmembrane protein 130 [Poeciliopsis prolifica]